MFVVFKRYLDLIFLSSIFSAAQFSSGIKSSEEGWRPLRQTFKQRQFSKEEFYYLNVTRVGMFTSNDMFDCTFECVRNTLCLSINMAASRGADGKLWCELLSSDKSRADAENYSQNMSSHHLFIRSPCSSSPCQNGGTCIPNYDFNSYDCLCAQGFVGEYCQKAVKSCKELYDMYRSDVSKLVTLRLDSKPVSVLCHMGDFGCGDGGWTPVMKMDGNMTTFHHNAHYWSDYKGYNLPGGKTGFDEQETKLPTYWNTSFSKICLGMKIDQQLRFIVIHKKADSLYSLIADGQYRATSLGRDKWKELVGSQGSLQYSCNKEGFNAVCSWSENSKTRIGIVSNNQNECSSCDSRIGFGTGGNPDNSNTCGNEAGRSGVDNGIKHIKAMGYILVQ
ncbi:uncharacterized protein LOC113666293 [Pocillopora damicornis]|uniref:uncharacterized protein LOC113666293 n=1 Tax=Pocillopora damicornis TaxID=46731 RepID=UPI000F54F8FF|nr:uncharacterized protein LOC113666293 [Pocillopora damicornis]